MAPSKANPPPYSKDERVLCFHHEMLYEAKVLDSRQTEDGTSWQYKIHYKGWKNTWDDWVPQDRVRKFTDENKELAAQLHLQMKQLQGKAPPAKSAAKKGGRANGSDFSSARGSEERNTTAAQGGRGPRRNRDYDLEHIVESSSPSDGASSPESPSSSPLSLNTTSTSLHVMSDPVNSISPVRKRRNNERTSVTQIRYSLRRRGPIREFQNNLGPKAGSKLLVKRHQVAENTLSDRELQVLQLGRLSHGDMLHNDVDLLTFISNDKNLPRDPLLDNLPRKSVNYIVQAEKEWKAYNKTELLREKKEQERTVHPTLKKRHEDGTASKLLYLYFKNIPHHQKLPFAGIFRDNDTNDTLQEEGFHARPSIKLVMPDHLKAILVDDWENVTKNQQLVPLPSAHPVNSILADYLAFEQPRRQPDSSEADLLEEVIAGLKQYFDKSLGRILLYRFERSQYYEVIQGWEDKDSPLHGKTAGDTYGPEHLCRLLVSLPELIAQTNMDQPSVNRLREELTKLTNWLGKHAIEYFVNEYETPSQSYIEKARA